MQGTITWTTEGEIGQSGKKRPDQFRIGGDDRYFSCFDMKNRQVGDSVIFDAKNKPYNGKDQWTAFISDEVPATDTNTDVKTSGETVAESPMIKAVVQDDRQQSIIAQTLCKCVAQKFAGGAAIPPEDVRKEVWEDYKFFLEKQTTKEPF